MSEHDLASSCRSDAADAEEPSIALHEATLQLLAHRREFLTFVERRVGDRVVAEEILQDAFVRGLQKLPSVRETVIGWFYRLLRNALIDHQRRAAVAARRLDAFASEQTLHDTDTELYGAVCTCVSALAAELKPEYAEALQRIEVDGVSVKDYAAEAGITAGNAGVRIFRARRGLGKQVQLVCGRCATHGCNDCTCRPPSR